MILSIHRDLRDYADATALSTASPGPRKPAPREIQSVSPSVASARQKKLATFPDAGDC
jgi:hypothetical protein